MKTLLINPPVSLYKKQYTGYELSGGEPLGILYIAAYLRQKGEEVKILDCMGLDREHIEQDGDYFRHGLGLDAIYKYIKDYNPDVIGIASMFTLHYHGVQDVAKVAREACPKALIVVGGSNASALPQMVIDDTNVDIVVIGEGELTLLEIVEKQEKGEDLLNVLGTVVREDGKMKRNPPREFIKDLDSLPFPARDMIPIEAYYNDKYRSKLAMRPPRANMTSSRGCPYNCVFCATHAIWRHVWRPRSAKNVVDEIEYLVKTYGIREIAFHDDNLSLKRDRMIEVCDEIIKRNLNIKWCTPNGIAIWTLDEEVLDKMKKSGCYRLTFGIETGCLETQKFIRKTQINLERAKKVINYCNRIGIWTYSAFIIGFPFETREDIEETIRYAINADLDGATFLIATPYPSTDLFDIYQTEKLLTNVDQDVTQWVAALDKAAYDTKCLTKEELQKLRQVAISKFFRASAKRFLNPVRFMRKVRSFEDFKYALNLATVAREILDRLKKTTAVPTASAVPM